MANHKNHMKIKRAFANRTRRKHWKKDLFLDTFAKKAYSDRNIAYVACLARQGYFKVGTYY